MTREIIAHDLSRIYTLMENVLGEKEYTRIERMGGLTNHTYHITLSNHQEYVFRIPGEGTEDMIIRSDEEKSARLACELGIDTRILYFGEDGTKVSEYIPNAITLNADMLAEDCYIIQLTNILKTLHSCNVDTGVPFEVFDMAANYEKIIIELKVPMFVDYAQKKQEVMHMQATISQMLDVRKVPCHNDPLCENWVEGNGKIYLIDWEYAGMNDGMWDVADVSIEAGFNEERDYFLLKSYLDREPNQSEMLHFLANKVFVDYLWTLWAKARVPFGGQEMEDWAVERYVRMKENIAKFNSVMDSE